MAVVTEQNDLSNMLKACFGDVEPHVYFNGPEKEKMVYPAIRYFYNQGQRNQHADNQVYFQSQSYEITVIDRSPKSSIARRVSKLPGCRPGRIYISDGLTHYSFTISLMCKEVTQ